jgi:hypothetical protein
MGKGNSLSLHSLGQRIYSSQLLLGKRSLDVEACHLSSLRRHIFRTSKGTWSIVRGDSAKKKEKKKNEKV